MDHIERSRNSSYLDATPLCLQADALGQRGLNSIWKARRTWTDTGEIELDGTQSIGCNGIETVLERARKGFRKNSDLHHDGWEQHASLRLLSLIRESTLLFPFSLSEYWLRIMQQ
jgi:hypothetical protein